MSQELPIDLRTRLTGLDREIAVRAIAALARGTPVEAAYQILAGIEALDAGPEAPMVMLWPKDDGYKTIEDRAAWHETEKDRLLARLEESQRIFKLARQRGAANRAGCVPEDPRVSGALPSRPAFQECFEHQRNQAGEPSDLGEAGPAAHQPSANEPPQVSNDE